ncbi:MAG TPA: peroxiredoxin [Kofleriaceae bacterium]|nr:peroxiredoxin [Kofleriaceae bacterium]
MKAHLSCSVVGLAVALMAAPGCSSNASSPGSSPSAAEETAPATAEAKTPAQDPAAAAEATKPTLLAVGEKAPDFTATSQSGSEVHLAALAGKPVVLYFYPKDFTSGCTLEAKNFRDDYSDFETAGATIIGVSLDSVESHKKFAKELGVPFLLVADPKGEIAAKYGVSTEGGYARRVTFVIDGKGVIAKTFPGVTVEGHAEEVLTAVRGLSS